LKKRTTTGDLPGCVTTGRTLEDTRKLIAEAIEFHIEGMRLHGEPSPEVCTSGLQVRTTLRAGVPNLTYQSVAEVTP
jgi:hypothetical protein